MRKEIIIKKRMIDESITQKSLSKKLGITEQTLCLKLKGKRDFTMSEFQDLVSILNISNDEIIQAVRR